MEKAGTEDQSNSPRGFDDQPSVALVIIGDEILSGRTRDENGPFLTRELARVGARVVKIVVIPDEFETIAGEVKTLSASHDFVITTGGVGPTHDDMTPAAVGRAFDTAIEVHPELRRMLADAYGERTNEAVLRMARVPVGTEIITGPGITFPPFRFRNVVMLPGVPLYLQNKFPLIAHLFSGEILERKEILVPRDETEIADLLADVAARNEGLKIGSYPLSGPDKGWNRVEVTVTGADGRRVDACIAELLAALPGSTRKGESAEEACGAQEESNV